MLAGELVIFPVLAVPDTGKALAQGDGLAVEVQHGVRVGVLLGDVDVFIILVDIKPRLSGGEPGVFTAVPLHRRPGGVPGGTPQPVQTHLLRPAQRGVGVGVPGLHVLVHVGAFRPPVGHADFLPLIEEGRPLLEQVHGGKALGALRPEFLAAVAGNDSGMVVIFDVKRVPAPAAELLLPGGKGFLHPPQAEFRGEVIGEQAVGGDALELDHHVQLAVLLVDVGQRPLRCHHGGFRQGEAVVVIQHVALELVQVFVDAGAMVVAGKSFAGRHQVVVRQTFLFGDVGDHVLPEAVHPHVQPEAQNPLHFLPHPGVVHIQVGLLHGEQV